MSSISGSAFSVRKLIKMMIFREFHFYFRLQVHVLSKAKKRRLRRQKLAKSEGDPKSETAGMDSRPNYLIAMQITNPQVSRVV